MTYTRGDILPLFKVFINDLPKALRARLQLKFPNLIAHDPAILVADDVIALSATLEQMQTIADECSAWAKKNGLRWNPEKSQLVQIMRHLRTTRQSTEQIPSLSATQTKQPTHPHPLQIITLDGSKVTNCTDVDYLDMRISTSRGIICKDPQALLAKVKSVFMMLSKEKWFTLSLHPKNIASIYTTYIRSGILYGSKLLNSDERQTVEQIEEELLRTFLKGLLKLKSIKMAKKQTKRLMILLRIPSAIMEIDTRCMSRIEAWSKRSVDDRAKFAAHTKKSIHDVKCLQENHPLRIALNKFEEGETPITLRAKQWAQLTEESKGSNATTSRHVRVEDSSKKRNRAKFPRFLDDPKLDPAMKRAILRWTVYKFPVCYKSNTAEKEAMNRIRCTDGLIEEEYKEMLETIRKVLKEEQNCWGLWRFRSSYVQDVRSRLRG